MNNSIEFAEYPHLLLSIIDTPGYNHMEIAQVDRDGTVRAFKPMDNESITRLLDLLSDKLNKTIGGKVPEGVLYVRPGFEGFDPIIWYTKPHRRGVVFGNRVGIESGMMNIPYLIWMVSGTTLSLYCCFEQPTEQTKLYFPPLMNIYQTHSVCMGSGSHLIRGNSFEEIIHNTEKAFWETVFTHFHYNPLKKNIDYSSFINSDKTFDPDCYSKSNKSTLTYGKLIQRFE